MPKSYIKAITTTDNEIYYLVDEDTMAELALFKSEVLTRSEGNTHPAVFAYRYLSVRNHPTLSDGVYMSLTTLDTNEALVLGTNVAKPSQSNAALNDLVARIRSNYPGTAEDLSTYTSNTNQYNPPRDGYLVLRSGDGLNDYITAAVQSNIRITAKTKVANYSEYNSLFVKAGMRIYVLGKTGNSTIHFYPFTL